MLGYLWFAYLERHFPLCKPRCCSRFCALCGYFCAFYSALVQLVAHSPATTSPEGLHTALQGLALPGDVVDELRELLQQPSALSQSFASPWLERLAAHFGERNWFVIAGDSTPIATGRGTRPGSSWADVLFALLMPKVLRKRDAILAALGATPIKPQFPSTAMMAYRASSRFSSSIYRL